MQVNYNNVCMSKWCGRSVIYMYNGGAIVMACYWAAKCFTSETTCTHAPQFGEQIIQHLFVGRITHHVPRTRNELHRARQPVMAFCHVNIGA